MTRKQDRIVALYGLGFTGPEIAEEVGCSSRLVYVTLEKRGVTRRPRGPRPDPTRRKRVVEEREERKREERGRAERGRAERDRAMVVMRANGSSMAEIAAHFDLTRQRVHQILQDREAAERAALNVLDGIAAAIEDMSDDEIAEMLRAEGRDPDADAEALRRDLLGFVDDHQRGTSAAEEP